MHLSFQILVRLGLLSRRMESNVKRIYFEDMKIILKVAVLKKKNGGHFE